MNEFNILHPDKLNSKFGIFKDNRGIFTYSKGPINELMKELIEKHKKLIITGREFNILLSTRMDDILGDSFRIYVPLTQILSKIY